MTVSVRLRRDESWAKKGHEVAFGQWRGGRRALAVRPDRTPQVVDGAANLGVRGEDFEILFSKQGGGMTSYRYGGRELLKSVPMPNFWRAPTDNDRGSLGPARYGQWKLASLYLSTGRLPFEGGGERPWEIRYGSSWVEMAYVYRLPTQPQGTCSARYRVFADGAVEVTLHTGAAGALGPAPEFGLMWKMDADFHRLRWYGLGPEATYCDRQAGGRLGIWEDEAGHMPPYLRPQECGAHTGVRWAAVTDEAGVGLLLEGEDMTFSALPYTPHELECAAHPHELPPVHYTVVRAAMKQMGLAGDDSWGARPAPEHLLPEGEMTFRFWMRGTGGK